jgi:hypothetical protein
MEKVNHRVLEERKGERKVNKANPIREIDGGVSI